MNEIKTCGWIPCKIIILCLSPPLAMENFMYCLFMVSNPQNFHRIKQQQAYNTQFELDRKSICELFSFVFFIRFVIE